MRVIDKKRCPQTYKRRYREAKGDKFAMNETTTAAVAVTDNVSEYHIGHTIYRVKTVFNPAFRQSLSDILARLITADCEKMLGDNEQKQDKQAV